MANAIWFSLDSHICKKKCLQNVALLVIAIIVLQLWTVGSLENRILYYFANIHWQVTMAIFFKNVAWPKTYVRLCMRDDVMWHLMSAGYIEEKVFIKLQKCSTVFSQLNAGSWIDARSPGILILSIRPIRNLYSRFHKL